MREGRGWGLGEGGMHVGGRDGLDFKVSILNDIVGKCAAFFIYFY